MPELPDVAMFKTYLDATSLHQTIRQVTVRDGTVLRGISDKQFAKALEGAELQSSLRHGKHLLIELDGVDWLNMHFGMSGSLTYYKDRGEAPKYGRILFSFSNGYVLAYVSLRKLGHLSLVESPQQLIRESGLGPDALVLDSEQFTQIIKSRRGLLKTTLMNQRVLAGLGNVYTDEILFQAKIPPSIKIGELDEDALDKLWQNTLGVLETAIDNKADPEKFPKTYLIGHRSPGEPCPRCPGRIEKMKISQRSTYFCPKCQGS